MIATIQHRRGNYADFDKTKMLPAELATVVKDDPNVPSGKALYIAFNAGDVHRLISIEDLEEMVRQEAFKGDKGDQGVSITNVDIDERGHLMVTLSDERIIDAGYIDDALERIDEAKQAATDAKTSKDAAEKAQAAAEKAQDAIENLGVAASSLPAGEDATVIKSVADDGVTLYFGIPRGEQGAVGPQGKQGVQGPEGPKGPQGESGVTTPTAGWFTLAVDSNGDLWAYYADTDTEPPLDYEEETGNLYYVVPDEVA